MSLAGVALAVLVGLSLGLLGGGGSILTVPILVYVLGFSAKESIGMSLAIVGAASLIGALGHWRAGNVNLRVAATFGLIAMAGTYLGARLAIFLSGTVQLTLFAIVMLTAAFFMFRPRKIEPPRMGGDADGFPSELPLARIAVQALGVGLLTGLVGVGGGFLIVPALVLLARLPIKEAVGTSLLVIAMNTLAGFVGYLSQIQIAWATLLWFTAAAATGILAGTTLVRFVPPGALRRAFAVFLVATGLFILYRSGLALVAA